MQENAPRSLTNDLYLLTTIPEKTIEALLAKARICVADDVFEANAAGEKSTSVDLVLGTLTIAWSAEGARYRFAPSAKLNQLVAESLAGGKSPLTQVLDAALVDRITNTYKDILG